MAGHDNDGDLRHHTIHRASEFQSVDGSGHVDVGEDSFDSFAVGEQWQGLIGTRRFRHHISGLFQDRARVEPYYGLIIDNENPD